MANPNDISDYIKLGIDNIQTILNNHKDFIGFKLLETNEDAFIPNYPAVTIEFDSMTEEWKSIPRRKTLNITYSITYYHGSISDKGVRRGLRIGLSKIANCLREQWDVNDYCQELGSSILSVTPYILASGDEIIAGGVINFQIHKVISVTIV